MCTFIAFRYMKAILIFFVSVLSFSAHSQAKLSDFKKDKLIFQDNFDSLSKNWIIETPQHKNSKVFMDNGKLAIDVAKGATVWYNKKLAGNYIIEYKRKVVVNGGANSRLSDLNNFWMASDPKNANLFTRTGVFEEYDNLSLYYVGMGGNTNSTTRFRKYGDNERRLLKEYTDKAHLLEANREYQIAIVFYNGESRFFVDGEEYFSFKDPAPLSEGYFGIRTTYSHHEIDDLSIYSLKNH